MSTNYDYPSTKEPGYGEPGYGEHLEAQRQKQIQDGWDQAIPRRFRGAKLADLDTEHLDARRQLEEWSSDPKGRNLVLVGPVGVGKSLAAVAAARTRYFDHRESVRFWPVLELLDCLRPDGTEGTLSQAMDAGLLILDDLGAEKPSEWTSERIFSLVNRRWLEGRPTIATSNLPATRKVAPPGHQGRTLEEAVGPRVWSRLMGNGTVIVRMTGPDRRR